MEPGTGLAAEALRDLARNDLFFAVRVNGYIAYCKRLSGRRRHEARRRDTRRALPRTSRAHAGRFSVKETHPMTKTSCLILAGGLLAALAVGLLANPGTLADPPKAPRRRDPAAKPMRRPSASSRPRLSVPLSRAMSKPWPSCGPRKASTSTTTARPCTASPPSPKLTRSCLPRTPGGSWKSMWSPSASSRATARLRRASPR